MSSDLRRQLKVAEFIHQPLKGKSRRHLVVRKLITHRPNSAGKLLFDDLPEYRYSIFVTNMNLPVDQLWNVYNSRADYENRTKELQKQLWIRLLLSAGLLGNRSVLSLHHASLQSEGLVSSRDPKCTQESHLKTAQAYCFALGSWVSSYAGKRVLKIYALFYTHVHSKAQSPRSRATYRRWGE